MPTTNVIERKLKVFEKQLKKSETGIDTLFRNFAELISAVRGGLDQAPVKAASAPSAKKAAGVKLGASTRGRKTGGALTVPQRIVRALGKKGMTASEIDAEMRKHNDGLPSQNPILYISSQLSKWSKGPSALFEQVSRGVYCAKGVTVEKKALEKREAVKTSAKKSAVKAARGKAVHEPAKKTASKETGPVKGRGCSICQEAGHNSRTHDKVKAAQAVAGVASTKAEPKKAASEAVKAAPKASKTASEASSEASAKTVDEKGRATQKCAICQAEGHNKRGHDKAVASSTAPAMTSTPEAAPTPAAEPKVVKSADDYVRERNSKSATLSDDDLQQAFA